MYVHRLSGPNLPLRPWPLLALAIALVCAILVPDAAFAQHRFYLGSGVHYALDSSERDIYEGGLDLMLAYENGQRKTRRYFEIALGRNDGSEFLTDSTFEIADSRVDSGILTVGLRTDLSTDPAIARFRLFAGIGLSTGYLRYRNPLGDRSSEWTYGLSLELRPEFSLGEHWGIWLRQRITALTPATFDTSPRFSETSLSTFNLDLGVSHALP